jgi:hypothetical protein
VFLIGGNLYWRTGAGHVVNYFANHCRFQRVTGLDTVTVMKDIAVVNCRVLCAGLQGMSATILSIYTSTTEIKAADYMQQW